MARDQSKTGGGISRLRSKFDSLGGAAGICVAIGTLLRGRPIFDSPVNGNPTSGRIGEGEASSEEHNASMLHGAKKVWKKIASKLKTTMQFGARQQ